MSPQDVELIVRRVLEGGVSLNGWSYGLVVLLSSLAALCGSFFGAYVGEKAKHLATKEDFKDLLDQQKKTTAATEEVRTLVADKAWLRQQIWVEKRKLYSETLQAFTDVHRAADGMAEANHLSKMPEHQEFTKMFEEQVEAHSAN